MSGLFKLLLALGSALFSTTLATQVTLRAAPIYLFDGHLNDVMMVVNLRTADGQPDRNAVSDWTLSGPAGWNTQRWTGPANDGFVWMRGNGQYLPGTYTLKGTVNGQDVKLQTAAPKVAANVTPFSNQVAVSSNWKAPFCGSEWPCWNEPQPDLTGVPANTLVISLKMLSTSTPRFGLAILSLKGADGRGAFNKSQDGKFVFTGLPDPFLQGTMSLDLLESNVPNLFAPQSQINQPLLVHRVPSRYFSWLFLGFRELKSVAGRAAG